MLQHALEILNQRVAAPSFLSNSTFSDFAATRSFFLNKTKSDNLSINHVSVIIERRINFLIEQKLGNLIIFPQFMSICHISIISSEESAKNAPQMTSMSKKTSSCLNLSESEKHGRSDH